MLTQAQLKEYLHYDPDTGDFIWLKKPNKRIVVGSVAGYLHQNYIVISLMGEKYEAHRLAFFYMNGLWPTKHIDHANGIGSDNRWANIRECTASQNGFNRNIQSNNTSGFKGVSWVKASGKWRVVCSVNKVRYYLGSFDDVELAGNVYAVFAKEHHGEFYPSNIRSQP